MRLAAPRRNKIALAVPYYNSTSARWLLRWEEFKRAFARYPRNAGLYESNIGYIDAAMNTLVSSAFGTDADRIHPSEALRDLEPELDELARHRNPRIKRLAREIADRLYVVDFDYLLFIESDNVVNDPERLFDIVASLDPRKHKIVGFPYVGRTDEDLRPVAGVWEEDGRWHRLEYDAFKSMLDRPGFHEVGSVGMGCVAIHRSVFLEWQPISEHGHWFHNQIDETGNFNGHDVWFCHRARQQGHKVWLNTRVKVGHIGEFTFWPQTYIDTYEFEHRLSPRPPAVRLIVPHTATGLREETIQAVDAAAAELNLDADYRLTEGDSGLHDLIAEMWAAGEPFLTVEQDIVPTSDQIGELARCPEPWCALSYEYPPFPAAYAGMGCAKFSADLLGSFPDALIETGQWTDPKHPAKFWCTVDGRLKAYLTACGAVQHDHGLVTHLHKGRPAHDCVTATEAQAIMRQQGLVA